MMYLLSYFDRHSNKLLYKRNIAFVLALLLSYYTVFFGFKQGFSMEKNGVSRCKLALDLFKGIMNVVYCRLKLVSKNGKKL